jgi:hypothetical protein
MIPNSISYLQLISIKEFFDTITNLSQCRNHYITSAGFYIKNADKIALLAVNMNTVCR